MLLYVVLVVDLTGQPVAVQSGGCSCVVTVVSVITVGCCLEHVAVVVEARSVISSLC